MITRLAGRDKKVKILKIIENSFPVGWRLQLATYKAIISQVFPVPGGISESKPLLGVRHPQSKYLPRYPYDLKMMNIK